MQKSSPLLRVAHVLTSSVSAQVLNRPSSKNITVKTTVGRLTAYGLSNGTTGEGGEGPIVVFSKHGDEGKDKPHGTVIHYVHTLLYICSISAGSVCGYKPSQ